MSPHGARLRWVPVALGLAMIGCGPDGDASDEASRYLGDRAFRRARLIASLVAPDNGYSRLRLARYATGADGDWDALDPWNPPVATIGADGALRDDERALDTAVSPRDDASLRTLGEAAFFRYPAQLAPIVGRALETPDTLARYGLWRDPNRGAAGLVSVRLPDGTREIALTCATCHARIAGPGDGQPMLIAGLPNQALDLGALARAFGNGGASSWGPGRIDVAPPPGEEPVAIPDLRPVALTTHLHRCGTVRNDPIALAIRLETLLVTAHGAVVRPPREVALALGRYLAALAPPPPLPPVDGTAAFRGAAHFAARCAGCHRPPHFAGPPVPLDVVGTDPRVGRSRDRGTGGYRVPSLRGVSTRGALLHDARVPDLAALFDPARLDPTFPGGAIPGHTFGLDLTPDERADLLAYLESL